MQRRSNHPLRVALLTMVVIATVGRASERPAYWVFLNEFPNARLGEEVRAAGGTIRTESRWLRAFSIAATPDAVERIVRLPFVRQARPVASFRRSLPPESPLSAPALDAGASDFQLRQIGLTFLHDKGYQGDGVKIGVLDTGFSTVHQAFRQARIADAYDFVHGDPTVENEPAQDDPFEDEHGTQVLSILAGDLPGRFLGAAPEAEYYLAKTEDVTRNGLEFEARVEEDLWIAGLEWCAERGCRIVNSSLGYSGWYAFPDLDGATAVVTLAAEEAAARGILIVNAAGNSNGVPPRDNTLRGRIGPPADGAHVLAVGAALSTGAASRISAEGPTFDGRVKPDVLALGVQVAAVSVRDDTTITTQSGTSVAAPLATGAVALLLQAFPRATIEDLVDALRGTASLANTPDSKNGYGLVSAERAFVHLAERFQPTDVTPKRETRATTLSALKRQAALTYLESPYPNPTFGAASIRLRVVEPEAVRLCVMDVAGKVVCTFVDGELSAGAHTFRWEGRTNDGAPVARGVYLVSLTTRAGVSYRRIIWRRR